MLVGGQEQGEDVNVEYVFKLLPDVTAPVGGRTPTPIRMLSNLETEKSRLLQIILIGQPDLRDKLDRPELEQLRQRITVSYHLEPLDAEETAHYVNHRLARASISTPLEFPRDVTDAIHARSGGVPRLINVIADATLVFGYGEERPVIESSLVQEVIADLDATGVLGPRSNPNRRESVVPSGRPYARPPWRITARTASSSPCARTGSVSTRASAGTCTPCAVTGPAGCNKRRKSFGDAEALSLRQRNDVRSRAGSASTVTPCDPTS